MSFISEEIQKDVETEMLDIDRAYKYTIEENLHTKDIELTIIWNDGIFGEYLYNTKEDADQDIEVLCMMGFNINEA